MTEEELMGQRRGRGRERLLEGRGAGKMIV